MRKTSLGLSTLAACVVLAAAYVVSVSRQSADLLVVQATSASSMPARKIAWWMLRTFDRCPRDDFRPATPVGFVIAGWEKSGRGARFASMLDLLVERGCDIDGYSNGGLTPLHSAVLFNNGDAVRALLRLGANRSLATAIPARDGGRPIELDARAFADYLDTVSGEDRSTIIEALE